jgi:hypothetical protein
MTGSNDEIQRIPAEEHAIRVAAMIGSGENEGDTTWEPKHA